MDERIGRSGSFVVISFLLLCGGCASTRMRSFLDPDFRDHRYNNLLIAVRFENLDQQADAEDIFVKHFSTIDGSCRRSLDILLPTRQFSDEELFNVLRRHNIDAVIIVRETDYYEEEYYVPQSTTTHSRGSLSANTYYHRSYATTYGTTQQRTHSYTTGGYTIRKPRVRHKVELYDVDSTRMAWTGGSLTRGNAYARFKNLVDALARETKKELIKQGLVATKKK